MNIQEKLVNIQTKIKAPKNLRNSFGNYNYRNFESICEAVKPYLAEQKCTLTVSDEIVAAGDRIYVKAIATLKDCESGESIVVTAFAREAAEKRGMDASQITGATSSYARKYAVNGLFLLDDTKDADSDEYHTESENRSKAAPKSKPASNRPADEDDGFNNLVQAVNEYINNGTLQGKLAEQAKFYINSHNKEGLEKALAYCGSVA